MTHLVLYDGVCGLCDHFVQFLLRIDRENRLRFAALQGPTGTAILKQHGREANTLSTVLVIPNYGDEAPRLLEKSDAALFTIASAGGIYRGANALKLVPRVVRDVIYDLIARWRYQIFGRFDACPIPNPERRAKFLDFVAQAGRR